MMMSMTQPVRAASSRSTLSSAAPYQHHQYPSHHKLLDHPSSNHSHQQHLHHNSSLKSDTSISSDFSSASNAMHPQTGAAAASAPTRNAITGNVENRPSAGGGANGTSPNLPATKALALEAPSSITSDGGGGKEHDIHMDPFKQNGWKMVKNNLRKVVEYGHREGILDGNIGPLAGQGGSNQNQNQTDEVENIDKADKHDDDVVKIATRDLSLIHAAVPFLPVPVAAFCFFMNVVFPGTGTMLSGFCGICMGQPRINFKEGRRFMTLIVNFLVGIAQMGTITFLLVGWFWSMAWGGLLLTHSLQYREALMQHRQEAVATAAIEALTRDAILRRRDVRTLVQERKVEQGQQQAAAAAAENGRRRSMFSKLGGKLTNRNEPLSTPNGTAIPA